MWRSTRPLPSGHQGEGGGRWTRIVQCNNYHEPTEEHGTSSRENRLLYYVMYNYSVIRMKTKQIIRMCKKSSEAGVVMTQQEDFYVQLFNSKANKYLPSTNT